MNYETPTCFILLSWGLFQKLLSLDFKFIFNVYVQCRNMNQLLIFRNLKDTNRTDFYIYTPSVPRLSTVYCSVVNKNTVNPPPPVGGPGIRTITM